MNAANAVQAVRERLKMIQRRALIAMRATAQSRRPVNPKTQAIVTKCVELDALAELVEASIAEIEEDAANEEAEREIAGLAADLDKIGIAVRERVNGPPGPRLERAG